MSGSRVEVEMACGVCLKGVCLDDWGRKLGNVD
jgi:hypothetical protein